MFWYWLANAFGWAGALFLWVASLRYTSTVRASLFGSVYPLILVAYVRYTGVRISRGEVIGVLLTTAGMAITLMGGSSSNTTGFSVKEEGKEPLGDAMNIAASALMAMDIVLMAHARSIVPLYTYTTALTACVVALSITVSLLFEDASLLRIDRTGVFGWAAPDVVGLMLLFGLVVGMVGIVGFNFAVKHLSAVLFSSMQLIDPVLTGIIAWLWGLEGVPSYATGVGGVVVIAGKN